MRTVNPTKRCSVLCAALMLGSLTAASMPVMQASAADDGAIVVIGDSIASGQGLKEGEAAYADYLREYTGGTVTNLAVSGYKTGDLITFLDDSAKNAPVASAKIICVSIGANDLIDPAKEYFKTLQQEDEGIMDTVKRLAKEDKAVQLISGLTKALREPRKTATANFTVILEKLRALNPDARIIMQTIYNPAEMPKRYFTSEKFTESDIKNYNTLCTYVGNNLEVLNKAMRALDGVEIADVSAAFGGVGWMFTRILEKDVHPTPFGHAMIAAIYMDMLGTKSMTFPRILPLLAKQDYSDFLSMKEAYRTSLMKYVEGETTGKFGDANSDGNIDSTDAQLVLNMYVRKMAGHIYGEGVTYAGSFRVDINMDGNIGAEDAQYILNYYVRGTVSKRQVTWAQITGNPDAPED